MEPNETLTTHELRDGVAIITLAGSRRGFPLSRAAVKAVRSRFAAALADDAVDAVVIINNGPDFCFGANLKEMRALLLPPSFLALGSIFRRFMAFFGAPHPSEARFREAVAAGIELCQTIYYSRKPVVMAIRGRAIGGGAELAAAGDYRVAQTGAVFGFPEVLLGIVPGWLGCLRLPQILFAARSTALEILCSGRTVQTEEAEELGFFNVVVPGELLETAVAAARELAADPLGRPTYRRIHNMPEHTDLGQLPAINRSLAGRLLRRFFRDSAGKPFDVATAAETEMLVKCVRSFSQLICLARQIIGRRRS